VAEPISISQLGKTYPGGNVALSDVSINVDPGTFLVLLGPSGSGKTTLLRCLAGIEKVSTGTISIGGRVVASGLHGSAAGGRGGTAGGRGGTAGGRGGTAGGRGGTAGGRGGTHIPPDRRDLSMVFQDYALWPHLSAADNVAFALRRRHLPRAQCRSLAAAMLDRVGLGALAARYPNQLSGGEQQRVALARALIADTGLILCDEPLSNLDADLRERMRVEISTLVREAAATTVYITHDQAEAFALADQVGVLENGRLVQQGTPEEIYTEPATPFVARFTGLAGELPARVKERNADGTVLVEPSGGTPFLARSRPTPSPADSTPTSAEPSASASAIASVAIAKEVTVLIRPTGVHLCSTGADGANRNGASGNGADANGASANGHHLTGRVTDVAFRGRGYEHAIDIDGLTRLTGVLAEHKVPRGEQVGVRLDLAACHAFPVAGSA
jgi:iron(III) transport system ATP-binding protein